MTPFEIFAICLTLLLGLYFGIQIPLDLYFMGKEKKDDSEIIEGVDDNTGIEQPKEILEQTKDEDADLTYTDQVEEDGVRIVNPTSEPHLEQPQAEEQASSEIQTSAQINEEHEAYMEDIEATSQQGLYANDFLNQINDKYKKRNIIKTNAIDRL